MNNFCENSKCIFHSIQVDKDDVVLVNKEKKEVKRFLNKIQTEGGNNDVWLCEYCTGVLELIDGIVTFSRMEEGVIN